jgi:capsular exopolysaccharide synthesis family protein
MTSFGPTTPADPAAPGAPAGHSAPAPAPVDVPRRNPLLVVWRGRWIVLTTLVIGLAAAIVYLVRAVPIYESRARVMVQPIGPRIMPNDPTGAAATQNFLFTQADVIMSYDLLATVPDELHRMGRNVAEMPSFKGTDPRTFLAYNVIADVPKRQVDIITIRVRSPYPKDAPLIANAVVEAFQAYHSKEQQTSARKVLELLFNEKSKFDRELNERRQAKLEFLRKNRIVATGSSPQNPALERLAKLTAALTETELATLQAQAAYDATKTVVDDPAKVRQFVETRQFRGDSENLRREFRDLRKRLAGMSGQYLPSFPELNAIQASLKALNEEMVAEDKRIVEAHVAELEQRLLSSKRLEDQLRQTMQAQRAEVLELNDVAAQYQILEAEIASLEKTSDVIDTRIKELGVTENASPLTIRVVEAAREDNLPVHPAKARTLFTGLAAGLMLGALLALVRDWVDQRLRSVDEIKQVLGLPMLGVVPHMQAASPGARGMQVHLDPTSDVAESYRTVRTAVYFGAGAGRARTLLITSPQPGDGKTTLASNLAIAMAQAGNRVLLLDADFRRPTQHKIFEIDRTIGISNVLAGQAMVDQAICHSMVPGLDLLPCGPIPANPSEILNGQAFADLLERLSRSYDHVVIDSPPIVPVTDSRILAASCQATVVALRAERSTRSAAVYARDMLQSVGANLLGVVVNDVPRRRASYGDYAGDGYVYQYGYGRRGAIRASSSNGANGANGSSASGASIDTSSAVTEKA